MAESVGLKPTIWRFVSSTMLWSLLFLSLRLYLSSVYENDNMRIKVSLSRALLHEIFLITWKWELANFIGEICCLEFAVKSSLGLGDISFPSPLPILVSASISLLPWLPPQPPKWYLYFNSCCPLLCSPPSSQTDLLKTNRSCHNLRFINLQ